MNVFLFLCGVFVTSIAFLYWISFGMDIFCIIELILALISWVIFVLGQK